MNFNVVNKTIYVILAALGIVGNTTVFVNYSCNFGHGIKNKSIQLILIHLVFTNTILLLSKGMPKTVTAFGLRNFLGDSGCKIVVYLERVSRGLSVCTSSLLTMVQAITVSPRNSGWRRLKLRSTGHICSFFLFFWIFNSLLAMNLVHSITDISMNMLKANKSDYSCYFLPERQKMKWLFLTFMVLRDAVFQVVMCGSSGYMVFLLHKHHQSALYLQNPKIRYKTAPEIKAAQNVLLLMLCFFFFYWIDCVLSSSISFFIDDQFMVINIREFLAIGYAILSPFVVIHRDGYRVDCWHVH
ncbi:putative vomeronasal receptor-like protein 4 [Ctenodactylus gundi]